MAKESLIKYTADLTSGFSGFCWRHRIGLAPLLTGLLVLLVGTTTKFLLKLELSLAVVSYAAVAVVLSMFNLWAHYDSHDEGWHRRRSSIYVFVVIAGAISWLIYWAQLDTVWVSLKTGIVILMILTMGIGLPYWFNLRLRSRVRLENQIDEWPILTKGTALANTHWSSFTKTSTGWRGTLTWDKGKQSRRRVRQEAELVESLMDAPPGSVSIELSEGAKGSNKAIVTCVDLDPYDEPIEFDGVFANSICDLVEIGNYSDRSKERTRWWEPGVGGFHRLVAGVTRSGKSGLMHLLIAKYSKAKDVAFWGVDLKGGAALLPWAPLFDWLETDIERAMQLVLAAAQEVDRRGKVCGTRGTEVWEPTEEEPVIVLFCDEIASLIGDSAPRHIAQRAGSALVEIARKGAGMGVLMVLATQYPTLAALGSSQLKSQLTWRACFRLSQADQAAWILPNATRGVDPYNIPKSRRGTCYIDAEGEFRPITLRVQFIDRPDIPATVELHWEDRPEMGDIAVGWRVASLRDVYEDRVRWTPEILRRLRDGESLEDIGAADLVPSDLHDLDGDGPRLSLVKGDIGTAMDELDDDSDGEDDGPPENEIARRVSEVLAADPQRARREESERAAYMDSRRPAPKNQVEAIIFSSLGQAGADGLSPADLAKATGRRERTIHRYLERQMDEGVVMRIGYGRYRLTVTPSVTPR